MQDGKLLLDLHVMLKLFSLLRLRQVNDCFLKLGARIGHQLGGCLERVESGLARHG